MPLPLESDRLIIRPFRASDLESFFAYRNDPAVARYQGWHVPYAREKAVEFIEEMQGKQTPTPGEWLQLAVELKSSGALIGDWAFHLMKNDARQAYIGYTLAQQYWKQGYAAETMRCLLRYLFTELDLHRVAAECDAENSASARLLERTGFRREGHFVESVFWAGTYGSEYQYALLKREWDQLQHADARD